MGPLIDKVAKDNHIGHVIDLGAGQGYLSRTMAFQYDLQVMAIDGSEVQTCGAKRFDTMAIKGFKDKEHLIHHVTDLFTPENATDILQSLQQQHTHPSLLICGLHACGDLSTMMLRLFTQQSDIQALVNVGCCYHFLSHQGPSPGFPMSRTLQSFQLGSTACMLACQAPSRWLDQKEASIKAYEHHFFRCLLQWMMIEKGLISATDKAPIIGRLNKKRDFDSFPIYVKAALTRLGMDPNAISSDDAAAQYHHYKHTAQVDKRIAVLWTLRALLGPVIESFILMDRYMYLEETVPPSPTKSVSILPLFDDLVSPRNMVIVATK
ncbi:methyltransferase domain-containing protein [Halteromyces radiatus]|uniref:methyltransferase domain-containing protein n=1 Tax=Halteromyces radiatus TaxID=101107 RepID=UPI0022212806|nr:methyltransferase domain-containing protein [Halteromyces radiatus]KAI8082960.1 methyltransferase domain-containing protein [Halteromyces radiatus]